MMDDLQRAAAATGDEYRRLRGRLLSQTESVAVDPAEGWPVQLAAAALALWRSSPEECASVEAIAAGMYRVGRGSYLGGAPAAWTRAGDIAALGPAFLPRVLELLWFERSWRDAAELSALLMALTLFGGGEAVAPLSALLAEAGLADAEMERIAETLGRLGDPAGMPALARLADDAQAPLGARREAARWLGIHGVREPFLDN